MASGVGQNALSGGGRETRCGLVAADEQVHHRGWPTVHIVTWRASSIGRVPPCKPKTRAEKSAQLLLQVHNAYCVSKAMF